MQTNRSKSKFLPLSWKEAQALQFKELDVLLISGDAYIDHPAFGISLIARFLESLNLRVAIAAQPRVDRLDDLTQFPKPNLFIGISSGTVDSMINNYTANKRRRSDDMYSEGGVFGRRPDRAATLYSNLVREAFPESVIILGGIEASLRRLAHYDYWDDQIRGSILCDVDVDFLLFGMSEHPLKSIVQSFKSILATTKEQGVCRSWLKTKDALSSLYSLRGLAYLTNSKEDSSAAITNLLSLASFEEVAKDKRLFLETALQIEAEINPHNGKKLAQPHGKDHLVIVNETTFPLSTEEFDALYKLPFTKRSHPSYKAKIPAEQMIQDSITSTRGCVGGCSFCAITLHQGKIIQSRSKNSILDEIKDRIKDKDFKGHITDIGGPTANSWQISCSNKKRQSECKRPSCLYPKVCPFLKNDHKPQIDLLRDARRLDQIKSIRISSGVRYDLALSDIFFGQEYLQELIAHHVGGQLKVAPEHLSKDVLDLMRKPCGELFEDFVRFFQRSSKQQNKEQYLVPYFISAFPGSTAEHMRQLKNYLTSRRWHLQQVQSFIPSPMTIASAIYWSELHPVTKKPIFVAKTSNERTLQQDLLQPKRGEGARVRKGDK